MENNSFFCNNCGHKLPAESSFCPYCMTKFTEETPISTIENKKSSHKPLLVIIAAVVCVALICSFIFFASKDQSEKEQQTEKNIISENITSDEKETSIAPTNESEIKDSSLGLSSMKLSQNNNLNATEKLLIQFYDTDFFNLPYNTFKKSSETYENTQVCFYGTVADIVENNDNVFVYLVEYDASIGFDGIYTPTDNYVFVKCPTNHQLSPKSTFYFYGTYSGEESHTINGENYELPTFFLMKSTDFVYYDSEMPLFSEQEIRSVAKYFFGDKVTIREAKNDDFDASGYYDFEVFSDFYYVAETDNANFSKYCLYAGYGAFVMDCQKERYLTPAPDFEHFYLRHFDEQLETFTLECFDKNLNKIWSREFSETSSVTFDYTEKYIYLVCGENFYIINTTTGEDEISPKKVGEIIGLRKLADSILLISQNTITKTNLNGNTIWSVKTSHAIEDFIIQVTDDNYILQYSSVSSQNGWQEESIFTALITSNGTLKYDTSID